MQRIPPELTANAGTLRRSATAAERMVWQALRIHRPRFTRQLVVGHYIVDIGCRSAKIGVELDGGHHALQSTADALRTAHLAAQGWIILRFWNSEVVENLDGVVTTILDAVSRASTHPRPLPFREGS